MQEHEQAAYEVEVHTNNLEVLVSVHRECWNPWDWSTIARNPAPPAPPRLSRHEDVAKGAEAGFAPSLMDRMLGRETKKRQELAQAVELARQTDESEFRAALEQHRGATESWQWFSNIARGILAQDVQAYRAVLDNLFPLEDLQEAGTMVSFEEVGPNVVVALSEVRDETVVPREDRTLTQKGKLSVKAMPPSKYWALYQDHVCSCAIRVARETFALLPIPRVVVNVSAPMLDTRTGHVEPTTILGVNFLRSTLQRLNLDTLDPSDSMQNFGHRMKFKKTAGFERVEPVRAADAWANSR
jgi:hypothetical protein